MIDEGGDGAHAVAPPGSPGVLLRPAQRLPVRERLPLQPHQQVNRLRIAGIAGEPPLELGARLLVSVLSDEGSCFGQGAPIQLSACGAE